MKGYKFKIQSLKVEIKKKTYPSSHVKKKGADTQIWLLTPSSIYA